MYKKARKGIIKNFTGISDPYEKPNHPHIELKTWKESIDESVEKIYNFLVSNNFI